MEEPIICTDPEAWLGNAIYFWYSLEDAHNWGIDFKNSTGYFEVYEADIKSDNILDTVFNETHYSFWLRTIEKALKVFARSNIDASLTVINEYFRDKKKFSQFDGIMFQDIPMNKKRIVVENFYYRKRIQLGVFNINIISNFAIRYNCAI